MAYDPIKFAEKYQLASQAAQKDNPCGGISGFEVEWNLLDSKFRPLLTVGAGPGQQSFVDYLRTQVLPEDLRGYSQLEVFHWMIEWATRPYHHLRGSVYESRLMEGLLINALQKAGQEFGEQLYAWHGNLLFPVQVGYSSIPGSWHLAKRRYLEKCVDLYGNGLATAGIHTNLSLPDPLMALDFMHLSQTERGNNHLDEYKSQFYITGSRLLRAFAALFIAASASTPLKAVVRDGSPGIVLTEMDSVRSLTFPNPPGLDLPDLYRSYGDYLQLSYDLVRQGIRFGNNNWTPVRARSFAEPVERLINITSEQLQDIYGRGLYTLESYAAQNGGSDPDIQTVEEMARQIEIQNLLARINLPMARVEVRTDDGGGSLELDIANLTLKYLLLLRFYADREFGRSFRYDQEDILRARHNEELAARAGMRAEIENPFSGKPVSMRNFLKWTLSQVQPLAAALNLYDDLIPLEEIANGGPNTAEMLRQQLKDELNLENLPAPVPVETIKKLAIERQEQVAMDVQRILSEMTHVEEEYKLNEILLPAQRIMASDPFLPVSFIQNNGHIINTHPGDKTGEIIELAQELIRIPSVTACPEERLEEVRRAHDFLCSALYSSGLQVKVFNKQKYSALLAKFPSDEPARVMLSGHFDVVQPEPDDSQFQTRIEGDYLWGRGSADMKTVVATYVVWMKDMLKKGPPFPPVSLLLVGNEENGETEPVGTPHALQILASEGKELPHLFIAGERTGERGNELWGEICIQNRGVMRFEVIARGQKGHTGTGGGKNDVLRQLTSAQDDIEELLRDHLTLTSQNGWQSQMSFPFLQVGTPGVYNISPGTGSLGVEIRPIPQDNTDHIRQRLENYCTKNGLELSIPVMENGIACSPENPYLVQLIDAVRKESGGEPKIGRKLAGTSARFAPSGQGIVWGQSGIGPHARDERHFIPSILPYYNALKRYAESLL